MHEVGHALGLWHEQQRPDRDETIRILYDKLKYYKSQYIKRPISEVASVPYNVNSLMHYGPKVRDSQLLLTGNYIIDWLVGNTSAETQGNKLS